MKQSSIRRRAARTATLTAAAGALAVPFTAIPAAAAPALHTAAVLSVPKSEIPGQISRAEVIRRAKNWTDVDVPYSKRHHRNGYRTDCSGFVAMAWHLTTAGGGPNTDGLAKVASPISGHQLAAGDVLLMTHADSNDPNNGHVVIFVNWANAEHTAYLGMEEAGGEGAVMHVLPYPYHSGYGTFRPYRYGHVIDNSPGQDLLVNGAFEHAGGWQLWPGSNMTAIRGDGKAHGGNAYDAVNTGSLDPAQGPSFYQDVWGARLDTGTKYSYSIWVRPEADNPYTGRLDLWVIGQDGRQDRTETPFTAAPGTWSQVSVAETVPAGGYDHLRAQLYEDTPHDTLDVDDAVVTAG